MESVCTIAEVLDQSLRSSGDPCQLAVVGIVAESCAVAELYIAGVECYGVAVYVLTGQCQFCACDLLAGCVCLADRNVGCADVVDHCDLFAAYFAAAGDYAVSNSEVDVGCYQVTGRGSCRERG